MNVVKRMDIGRMIINTAVKIIRVVNPGWIITQTPNANRAPPDRPPKISAATVYLAPRMAVDMEDRSHTARKALLERLDFVDEVLGMIKARKVDRCTT